MAKVKELTTNKTDMCLISETKPDQTFPNQQFQIYGYQMLQKDRDKYGGGVLFYVRENISSKFYTQIRLPKAMKLYYQNFLLKVSNNIVLLSVKHHLKMTNT